MAAPRLEQAKVDEVKEVWAGHTDWSAAMVHSHLIELHEPKWISKRSVEHIIVRSKNRGSQIEPVKTEDDCIRLFPQYMNLNQYYLAELKGRPYLYRKVNGGEVEVYGLDK
jgi:hypothetical protein